ncbi:MAG: 30S ribosomal protein S15 [Planctomycetia bacterium]|nr:30S ribosomal protein S15 [Planctomycetia bacterium]MBL6914740.1 30S ribosomal protein S15 [Planctomycetota bacterium]MDG2085554.1 30S ribosomal protein S15 [Planctomycetota bacterium]
MSITAERKSELIQEFKTSENDRGSSQIQVAILTERIRNITDHLRTMKKDYASRRGLLVLVGKRTRLLKYLQRTNRNEYLRMIEALGLRR